MEKKGLKRKAEKEKVIEAPPAPLKIRKGEKVSVSMTLQERELEEPLLPTDFTFLPEEGSANHCNIPWFVNKDESKRVWTPLIYNMKTLRKLPFGCTRFAPRDGGETSKAFTCAVPIAANIYPEDVHHQARIQELEAILKEYLVSPEAASAWKQVNLRQPESAEDLHFNPLITTWKAKRTGDIFKDLRLKFAESFNGEVKWSATDFRV